MLLLLQKRGGHPVIKNNKGYSTFYKSREIGKGGGMCIFTNNSSVKAFKVEDIVYKGLHSDHIWCSLIIGKENILQDVYIGHLG